MSDQVAENEQQPPRFDVQPPTPVVPNAQGDDQRFAGHQMAAGHLSQGPNPIPIPIASTSSGRSSRNHTPSSSISSSYRHHPYSTSPSPSLRATRSRPVSSASLSDHTFGSDTELELELETSDGAASMELDATPAPAAPGGVDPNLALPGFSLEGFQIPPDDKPTPIPVPPIPVDAAPSTSTKPKTSHARKTPPGHIKRPPNAFILFRSHCCAPAAPDAVNAPGTPSAQQLVDLGITDHRHISRIASHLWKALTDDERGYWEKKARTAKEEHRQLHPEYRYKPIYRKKEEVRRRKKGPEEDAEEERRACEQVASALLNEEREQRAQKPERPGEQVDDEKASWAVEALASASAKAPPGTTTKRVRPPRAKRPKARPPAGPPPLAPLPSSSYQDSYMTAPLQYLEEPHSYDERPHSAPSGDFELGRRASRTVPYGEDDQGQFNYMEVLHQSQPHPHQTLHPAFDSPRRRSNTYSHYPHPPPGFVPEGVVAHNATLPPDAHVHLPHNPTFFYYPSHPEQQSLHPPQPSSTTQGPRPLTPRSLALNQLQNYNFQQASSVEVQAHHAELISPTGTTLNMEGSMTSMTPPPLAIENLNPRAAAYRRDSETMNLALRGMKRRGTLGHTTEGGDLMLISPTQDTFGGRKYSMGRWERRLTSTVSTGEEKGAEDAITAFEFDQSFFNFTPQPSIGEGFEEGSSRPDFSSASEYGGLPAFDQRPTTSASDFSAEDSHVADERHSGFGSGDSKMQAFARQETFHVGQDNLFLPPDPAHVDASRQYVFGSSPPSHEAPPVFKQDIFQSAAANYNQGSSRPSIDALLAAHDSYPRYARGSDATIRMRDVATGAAPKRDAAKAIIDHQLQGRQPEEFAATQFVYLSHEMAEDKELVDFILSHGVGVTYDTNNPSFAVPDGLLPQDPSFMPQHDTPTTHESY